MEYRAVWRARQREGTTLMFHGLAPMDAIKGELLSGVRRGNIDAGSARDTWKNYKAGAQPIINLMFQGGIVDTNGTILTDDITRTALTRKLWEEIRARKVVSMNVATALNEYGYRREIDYHRSSLLHFMDQGLYYLLKPVQTSSGLVFYLSIPRGVNTPSKEISLSNLMLIFTDMMQANLGKTPRRISARTALLSLMYNMRLWHEKYPGVAQAFTSQRHETLR